MSLDDVNFYFITDEGIDIPAHQQVKKAVKAGVKMVQYRDKCSSTRKMYEEARKIRKECKDTLFIVNDRLDVAMSVGADGVHLGQEDLPPEAVKEIAGEDMIIGISTHDIDQAVEAEKIADYIGVGPVHSTETKKDTSEELGIDGVLDIASKIEVPKTAIGGIGEEDLERLAEGVDMVCAISSVTRKGDLFDRISLYENKFSQYKEVNR